MLDEHFLAGAVALELAVELGHADVALIEDEQPVVREVVEQGEGRVTRTAAVEVSAVVLDPIARADLGEHLEVVLGAHAQALGLQHLAGAFELAQALAELLLDLDDRPPQASVSRHVVGGGEDGELIELPEDLAGQHVEPGQPLDLVTEQLDPDGVLLVGSVHLDGVATHAEASPHEVLVIALVLHVDEASQHGALVVQLPRVQSRGCGPGTPPATRGRRCTRRMPRR